MNSKWYEKIVMSDFVPSEEFQQAYFIDQDLIQFQVENKFKNLVASESFVSQALFTFESGNVEIRFRINFIQRTMLKDLIEKSSKNESKKIMEFWYHVAQSYLNQNTMDQKILSQILGKEETENSIKEELESKAQACKKSS